MDNAQERLRNIRQLHSELYDPRTGREVDYCRECGHPAPCPTLVAAGE